MRRIQDFISKRNIQRWLENYQALANGDRVENPDGRPVNSGPKPVDGISGGRINMIMLNQALDKLRQAQPLTYRCITARWLKPVPMRMALQTLDISQSIYYQRCREGVDFIYEGVNGPAVGYKRLLEALAKE